MLLLAACLFEKKEEEDSGAFWEDSATSDSEGCIDADDDDWCEEDDCDDDDRRVHPEGTEVCNDADDDCDDVIDEDAGAIYYADDDGDGYGDKDNPEFSCEALDGYADNGADCDDDDAEVHPGAVDDADGVDSDCDGETDEDAGDDSVTVDVDWDEDGVTFTVTGGAPSWELGMAETGVSHLGWFGESCFAGDEPWGYEDYDYQICHELEADGGFLPSIWPDIGEVDETNTLFNADIGNSGDITYFLADTSSSDCFVWGDDPTYYDDFGCEEI